MTTKEILEITSNPERAYIRGTGVDTIREALEAAAYSPAEIEEIIESFYA